MSERGTGKTFRAAGNRIVRQESTGPSPVTRLLGPPAPAPRQVASDEDFWNVRLSALARIGHYDGLMFVTTKPAGMSHAHNLAQDPTADAAIRAAVESTERSRVTSEIRAAVRLADGRRSDVLLLAPLAASEVISGVLIAPRAGRAFAAADAFTACAVADLVTLELARSIAARREDADRRQALTLYELARLALFGAEPREALQDAVSMLANTFDHDVAHVWVLRPGGSLQLRAAYPLEGVPLEIARAGDHDAIAEALRQGRVVRVHGGEPLSWAPSGGRELIVAPLAADGRSLGVLVFGRARAPYDREDEELAGVLGSFIARLVLAAMPAHAGQGPEARESPSATTRMLRRWDDERPRTWS